MDDVETIIRRNITPALRIVAEVIETAKKSTEEK